MNLTYSRIYPILEKEAINKTTNRLIKEGFLVKKNYKFNGLCFDLFAYNDFEKRIYEFKITKNKTISSPSSMKKYEILQQAAKEIGARLIYIYINPPIEGASVSFEGLEDLLLDDLNKKRYEIDCLKKLSSPVIQMVFDLEIYYISIEKDTLFVCGSAIVDIETMLVDENVFSLSPQLDYLENNNHVLKFEISLDKNLSIITSKYAFQES